MSRPLKTGKLSQGQRALSVSIALAAFLAAVALVDPVACSAQATEAAGASGSVPEISLEAVFSQVPVSQGLPDLPARFEEEVLDLSNFQELRVSSSGGIVGFSMPGTITEAYSFLSDALVSKGWKKAGSGFDSAASFIKEEGAYTWIYLSCASMGDTVSVVVQIV